VKNESRAQARFERVYQHILAAFFAVAGFLFVSFVFGAPTAEAAQTVPYKINFQED
jgi:hypothetical protein